MTFIYRVLPVVLAVILSFLLGCQQAVDIGKETETLLEADRSFALTSKEEGAPTAFRKYCTEEALQFTGNGRVIRGNGEIFKHMAAAMDSTIVLDWSPVEGEVSQSGDLGYTWGKYTVYSTVSGDGKDSLSALSEGVYVNVWKKQADGSWKVVLDIGNSKGNKE